MLFRATIWHRDEYPTIKGQPQSRTLRRFRVVIRFSRHAGLVRDDYIITANTALVEKAWAYSRSHVLCTAARLGIGDALEDEVRRILTCVWDLTDSQAMAR
ncbi:MAG TPA: hypothetical protein VI386_28515 [Candidatus Sulfotelmatobacter sp.]